MVEMHLAAIRVELPTNTPVVLLREINGPHRTLPILIGQGEATAIAYALQGIETARPLTHDLMRDLVNTLGVRVDRIVITELVDHIYFAEIHMAFDGRTYTVSSRPSDAIALAVRLGTPIYAEDELVEAEGVILAEDEETAPEEDEDLVVQFRQFIDEVRPEDFAS